MSAVELLEDGLEELGRDTSGEVHGNGRDDVPDDLEETLVDGVEVEEGALAAALADVAEGGAQISWRACSSLVVT
jgi:hypothetical protein